MVDVWYHDNRLWHERYHRLVSRAFFSIFPAMYVHVHVPSVRVSVALVKGTKDRRAREFRSELNTTKCLFRSGRVRGEHTRGWKGHWSGLLAGGAAIFSANGGQRGSRVQDRQASWKGGGWAKARLSREREKEREVEWRETERKGRNREKKRERESGDWA